MTKKSFLESVVRENLEVDFSGTSAGHNEFTADILRNPAFGPSEEDMKKRNKRKSFPTSAIKRKIDKEILQYGKEGPHFDEYQDDTENDYIERSAAELIDALDDEIENDPYRNYWWEDNIAAEEEEETEDDIPDEEEYDPVEDLPTDTEYEFDDVVDDVEDEDPNRQGLIRTIDDAHLVYKRRSPDSTYEELWIYNINDKIDSELEIRRAILAGTDIPQGKKHSDDGTQFYTLTTLGNAQLLHITGLPN